MNAHERQWESTTVNPLLNMVLQWQKAGNIMLLNLQVNGSRCLRLLLTSYRENSVIEPVEMLIACPQRGHLDAEDETLSSKSNSTKLTGTTNIGSTASRMIDWSLGLILEEKVEQMITGAFSTLADSEPTH